MWKCTATSLHTYTLSHLHGKAEAALPHPPPTTKGAACAAPLVQPLRDFGTALVLSSRLSRRGELHLHELRVGLVHVHRDLAVGGSRDVDVLRCPGAAQVVRVAHREVAVAGLRRAHRAATDD